MATTDPHFSDSEDEHEEEQEQEIEFDNEKIDAVEHKAIVDKLEGQVQTISQELEQVRVDASKELNDHIELFKKERAEHAEEMLKRQQRINFLMDSIISK